MKQKIYRLFAYMMVLALVVSPVSANQITGDEAPVQFEQVPAEIQELFAEGISIEDFIQMTGHVPRALEGFVEGEALMIIEMEGDPLAVVYAEQDAQNQVMSQADMETYRSQLLAAQENLITQLEQKDVIVISQYTTVYNGIQVLMPLSKLPEIQRLPEVKAVHRAPIHEIDLSASVPLIGAQAVVDELGYDGEGIVIAIIDTGIDYTHAAFGGSGDPADYADNDPDIIEPGTFPTEKVIGGYDFAGSDYDASGRTGSPIPQPDPDPLDEYSHGTHVASIAAGFETESVHAGVAPAAKLMALKVFGRSGSTTLVIDALEAATWSYLLSGYPQVINMSLGANFGTNDPANPSVLGTQNAAAAGIIVVASAGNAGNTHYITGSPATADKAISVAASTTGYVTGPTINIEGTLDPNLMDIIYTPASFDDNTGHYEETTSAPLFYVLNLDGAVNNQLCTTAGIAEGALDDTIALIQRGGCTFSEKVNNAAALGAIGTIIYNNVDAHFGGIGDPVLIPAAFIHQQDGLSLVGAHEETVIVDAKDDVKTVPDKYTAADSIALFSSRGPRGTDSALKPEITAPGQSTFAAEMGGGTTGTSKSGTSMAAPHIAGVAALMLQANPDLTPEQAKAAMMNTAVPLVDNTTIPRSGAGRVDAYRSVATDVIAVGDEDLVSLNWNVIMSRNDSVNRESDVVVYNWGDVEVEFDVSVAFQTGSRTAGATLSVDPEQVTVPAGGSATVTVSLELDMTVIPVDYGTAGLEEYYGFVSFTPTLEPVNNEINDTLLVPFYFQPRPYSELEEIIAEDEIHYPGISPATFEVTHNGPIDSSLWVYPALVWNETPDPDMYGPGDVRLFGMDFGWTHGTYGDIIVASINAHSPWHVPQPFFAEFDLYIDANQDGTWDYVNFNYNLGWWFGTNHNNQWLVIQVDLAAGMLYLGSPFLIYSDYNASYMEWYLPAAWQDLGPTDSTFDYMLLGFDQGGMSFNPPGQFDYANYPFGWMLTNQPGRSIPEATITVDVNDLDGYLYSQPLGVMIVDYRGDPRNQNGGQAYFQPIEVIVHTAYLQVAHLAPFAEDASVTITLDGEDALIDFAYGDSTGYIELLAGEYDVAVIPSGATDPAIEATVTLTGGNYYTVVAIGDGVNQDLELILLEDDLTEPEAGKFHLRLGHLAPFASGDDVLADVRLQDGTAILEDVDFGDVTGFIPLDAGVYDLKITTPGGAVTLIDPLPVDFAEGMIISAFASGEGINQDLGVFALPAGVEGFFLPLAEYGVELTPEVAALSAEPGETVEYTLTLTNSGNATDTFEITFEGNLWDVHLPETEFILEAGESTAVIVHVDIPAEAADGAVDSVSILATSGEDDSVSASATLVTTSGWYQYFMPLIFQEAEVVETFSLTILHTNDFHARVDEYNRNGARCTEADADAGLCIAGAPRLATVVDDIRAKTGNLLVLDAGDQFQGTLFFTLFQGEVLNETMNYIGYDAMAVGNHEFDSGPGALVDFIQGADFPVISTNIEIDALEEPELASLIEPYVILERGGHEIGIIGLITPDTDNISSPGPNVTFTDPLTSLQATADELMALGVDKIIALTHLGYDYDLELAESVSGVDIIIGGHSHSFTYTPTDPIKFGPPEFPQFAPLAPVGEYPTVVQSPADEPVLVVTAYQWGTFLGNLQVTFDHQGLVVTYGGNPIFLGADVEKDPVLDAMLDPYREAVQDLIQEVVGETTVDLPIIEEGLQICRLGECLLGNLVADAMLWMANEVEPEAGYQIAFQNGGGLRAPILTGPVTMGDVMETLPFGNTIATFELQGQYVLAALENGASRYPSANGGFAQVSGLRYTIDPVEPVGTRIVSIDVWNGTGWEVLDLDAMYKVVTNDFMRRGGDNYTMFRDFAVDPYDFGPLLDEALADYFMEFSPVTPEIEGRITILD
jgi:2',3'-cyclic-nucleotide 2'-phosphodiesterase (5'-nucleotidase family)/subtilisin family serine protease